MDTDFWRQRWEQQQIGFHQPEVNHYLKTYMSRLDLQSGAHVFVPLSGKSVDLLWLQHQGYRPSGVEISEIAVKDFFTDNALDAESRQQADFVCWQYENLQILCGDFFRLDPSTIGQIDAVFDRAALIALPPSMRPDYVRHVKTLVSAHSKMLIVTLSYDQSEMDGPPFSVEEGEIADLYAKEYEIEPLCSEEIIQDNPQFRDKGLSRLTERAYLLKPRER